MVDPRNVRRFVAATLFITIVVVLPVAAQPANDDCPNAITVVNGNYPGTSLNSTGDGFGICGSAFGSDVWYKFTAPASGVLFANTCSAANYDTVVGIWNGCPQSGGVELRCSDDACDPITQHGRSSTSLDVTASQQVWIRVSGYEGDSGNFTLTVNLIPGTSPSGPDVVYSEMNEVADYAPQGGIHAYSAESQTCNIGDAALQWGGTPMMTWNAYRLSSGRLEQVGLSWVKSGQSANAGGGCGATCSGAGGAVLGAGCKDTYGASFNGDQGLLGPRSAVNAFNGAYAGASGTCAEGDTVCKRIQIAEADLDSGLHPDALYFFEGVFVAADDAASGHALNNASYKRVTVAEDFSITPTGPISLGHPAIEAWRDHGLGLNTPDPDVFIGNLNVPDEGRFVYGYKATDLGNGSWHYEYAVYNLNSHRSGGSFSVFVPTSVNVSNVGFHDIAYHSGDPIDGSDWTVTVDVNGVTWTCPQTFAQNPNANALRYGTMYNFRFDANTPPATSYANLGLFRPADPDLLQVTVLAPGAPVGNCPTPGNLNGDTAIDGLDIQHFVNCQFSGSSPGGNCACGDMDNNGGIDGADVGLLMQALLSQ